MRNGLIILGIFVVFSCKAQQILSLNTSALDSAPNSYFKDSNNELDYFTGVWQGSFQDKTITLQISKQIKVPIERFGEKFFRDQIFVKYEVKKGNSILESSLNKDFTSDIGLSIKGSKIQDNSITLVFSGGNCSVGIGIITLKKINATQFSWGYYPGTTTRIDTLCSPDREYKIHLPETENLVFTKQ
ncbi:hypothetical protein KB553_13670 [Chryseobacterium rhizoplanae]|uniref:DUF6705 family protein n=1 Tax=Chryseobacterium TaxID=59732 RepID=UPI001CE31DDB|nr:DUF6705 family protein [Chryseobacterium rhizoplanae]UCA58099.1 hypothetical protein KB553_13670 [Chryseobacterium rhizoplanae]